MADRAGRNFYKKSREAATTIRGGRGKNAEAGRWARTAVRNEGLSSSGRRRQRRRPRRAPAAQ